MSHTFEWILRPTGHQERLAYVICTNVWLREVLVLKHTPALWYPSIENPKTNPDASDLLAPRDRQRWDVRLEYPSGADKVVAGLGSSLSCNSLQNSVTL